MMPRMVIMSMGIRTRMRMRMMLSMRENENENENLVGGLRRGEDEDEDSYPEELSADFALGVPEDATKHINSIGSKAQAITKEEAEDRFDVRSLRAEILTNGRDELGVSRDRFPGECGHDGVQGDLSREEQRREMKSNGNTQMRLSSWGKE